MTYYDLFEKATLKYVQHIISMDEYEEMIEPLKREISEDCVSREAVKKLKKYRFSYDTNTTIPKSDVFVKVSDIASLPSVEPSRPKGKWIHWTDDYKDYVTCSCCGYGEEGEVLLSDKTPFCPICGTDTRGENSEVQDDE